MVKDHTELNTCMDSRGQQMKRKKSFLKLKKSGIFFEKKVKPRVKKRIPLFYTKKAELFLEYKKDSR